MIVDIYQDKIKATDRLLPAGTVNSHAPWWAELSNGGKRPATESEVQLWQELQAAKADHQSACELAWGLYSAAMGVTVATFEGLPGPDPISVVAEERKRLLKIECHYLEMGHEG